MVNLCLNWNRVVPVQLARSASVFGGKKGDLIAASHQSDTSNIPHFHLIQNLKCTVFLNTSNVTQKSIGTRRKCLWQQKGDLIVASRPSDTSNICMPQFHLKLHHKCTHIVTHLCLNWNTFVAQLAHGASVFGCAKKVDLIVASRPSDTSIACLCSPATSSSYDPA